MIPYLAMADRGDETPLAIGVGVVGILAGLLVVRFASPVTTMNGRGTVADAKPEDRWGSAL